MIDKVSALFYPIWWNNIFGSLCKLLINHIEAQCVIVLDNTHLIYYKVLVYVI